MAGARTPEEIDTLFEEAMRNGDLDAVMDLYEPGAVFPWLRDEVHVRAEAIKQVWGP